MRKEDDMVPSRHQIQPYAEKSKVPVERNPILSATREGAQPEAFVVLFEPRVFGIWWVMIMMLHIVVVLACVGTFTLYMYIVYYPITFSVFGYLGIDYNVALAYVAIILMGCFTIIHLYMIGQSLYYSLQKHHLAFRTRNKVSNSIFISLSPVISKTITDVTPKNKMRIPQKNHNKRKIRSRLDKIKYRIQRFIQLYRAYLGVRGEFFEVTFNIREALEIGIQSYQAYRMSYMVPTPWINHFAVSIVVMNCWSTPILRYLLRHHRARERLACLVMDTLLNFSSGIVIPFVVFYPYIVNFDTTINSYADDYWYDPTWVINAKSELGLYFIDSFAVLLSLCIQHKSMLVNLTNIKILIKLKRQDSHFDMPSLSRNTRSDIQVKMRKYHLFHVLLWLYGGFILGVHLDAISNTISADNRELCLAEFRPWFANKYPCALMEIDCSIKGISGNNTELDNILSQVDASILVSLIFTECEAMEIPQAIQRFSALTWFEAYKSNIVSWPDKAAFNAMSHPYLTAMVFVQVRFFHDELPPGLFSPSFPKDTLIDIEFYDTNLKDLPTEISDHWGSPYLLLYLERMQLDHIPSSLLKMQMASLSIAGNHIQMIPDELVKGKNWEYLNVGANPIKNFSMSILEGSYIQLGLTYTNLTELPEMLSKEFAIENDLVAFGSPLCNQWYTQNFSEDSVNQEIMAQVCRTTGIIDEIYFPIEIYEDSKSKEKQMIQKRQSTLVNQ